MPEVPGVGDAADVADRRQGEDPAGPGLEPGHAADGLGQRRAGEDQRRGAEGRDQRRRPRERGFGGEGEAGVDDRRDADPAERHRAELRQAHRPGERERRAEPQLPGAGEGVEVGEGRFFVGEDHAVDERAGEDQRQGDPEHRPHRFPAAAPEPGHGEHQPRPDEVELLLDRQRPEVEDRARFEALGEVVDRLRGEVPVGDVEGGGGDVPGDFGVAQRRQEDHREDPDGRQQDRRERQQAFGAAGVEAAQADRAAAVELPQQEFGDQEARDDEEDVDPDVAARQERHPGVAEQDRDDRDRAQPLDVRPKRAARLCFVGILS